MEKSNWKVEMTPKLMEIPEVLDVRKSKTGLLVQVSILNENVKEAVYKKFEEHGLDIPFKIAGPTVVN